MLWRGIDPEYKRRYARVIWDQFQARLRDEAFTVSRISQYVSRMQIKFPTIAWGKKEDLAGIDAILSSGLDRALLRILREDTALVVVKVRLLNEQRRADMEREYQEWLAEQNEEAVAGAYDNVQADFLSDQTKEEHTDEN